MIVYGLSKADYVSMLNLPDEDSPGEFVEQTSIERHDVEADFDFMRGLLTTHNKSIKAEVLYVLMDDGIIIHY